MPATRRIFTPRRAPTYFRDRYNPHGHSRSQHHHTVPYPTVQDAWDRSSLNDPEDPLEEFGMRDFLLVHRRLARRRLQHLDTTQQLDHLLFRGVDPTSEDETISEDV